jgi:hypothetical protein
LIIKTRIQKNPTTKKHQIPILIPIFLSRWWHQRNWHTFHPFLFAARPSTVMINKTMSQILWLCSFMASASLKFLARILMMKTQPPQFAADSRKYIHVVLTRGKYKSPSRFVWWQYEYHWSGPAKPDWWLWGRTSCTVCRRNSKTGNNQGS